MDWRKTAILGAVFVVALAAFWAFEVRGRAKREREKVESQRLLPNVERIYRFRIETRSDVVEVAQDTTSKQWQVVAPVFYPADNDEVQEVLKAALEAHYTSVVSDSGDPRRYGLAPKPWVKFTAEGKTFLLGDETPTKSGVYAKLEGDPRILVVPFEYRRKLLKVSYDLRDKSILPSVEVEDIDSVRIARPQGELFICRKGVEWWLSKPIEAKGDNSMVGAFLRTLLRAKAAEFAAEDHSDSTLDALGARKEGEITFYTKSGAKLSMRVYARYAEGDTTPEFVYVSTPEKKPLFEVSDLVWRQLRKNPTDLRDRSICDVKDADMFAIRGPDGFEVEGRLSEGGWVITKPDSGKGDVDQIERMLRNFTYARVDSFRNDSNFKPSGWEFFFSVAGESTRIEVGDTVGNRVQVRRKGEGEYFLVHKTNILKWCKPNWRRFVSRRLVDVDATQLVSMTVRVGDSTYVFRKGKKKWHAKTPQGKEEVPFYRVRRAMDAVVKLTFTKQLPETTSWDEQNALLRAEFTDIGGNSYYIAIGDTTDGGRIAAASGQSSYFLVSKGAIKAILNKLNSVVKKKE